MSSYEPEWLAGACSWQQASATQLLDKVGRRSEQEEGVGMRSSSETQQAAELERSGVASVVFTAALPVTELERRGRPAEIERRGVARSATELKRGGAAIWRSSSVTERPSAKLEQRRAMVEPEQQSMANGGAQAKRRWSSGTGQPLVMKMEMKNRKCSERLTMTMDRIMRRWRPLLLVLCFAGSCSQTSSSDSCTTALSLGSLIPFNTTGLSCFPAWKLQDLVLRFGKDASGSNNVWNFVLSAPDSGGYIALGFSPDGMMVGSSAVVGWVTPDGVGTARQYYLGGTSSPSCPPDQGKLSLSLSRGAAAAPTIVSKGSRLYLAFQLSGQPLTDVIYAVGQKGNLPGPNGLLSIHLACITGTISDSRGTSAGDDDIPVTR
uniref:DOMON domain-containing protein n=2 Tax=Oryza punctata TaxID=4537 RepID=A0A0E0JS35_ORYPU